MQNYISNSAGLIVPAYSWEERQLPKDRQQGNNARGILVLTTTADIPEHLPFLKKVLRSIDCDFESDIAFATIGMNERFALMSDEEVLKNEAVLAFGIPPQALGIAGDNQVSLREFENITIILAPALAELTTSPEAKQQLWADLKRTFKAS